MRGPSRRSLLFAGGLAATAGGMYGLVEADVVPGKGRLDRALGRCGEMPVPPAVTPGPVESRTFRSPAGGQVRAVVGWPPGTRAGTPLPVAVLLHGANGDARTPFDTYAVHRYLAEAATRRGVRPFAVAAVDDWSVPGLVADGLLPYLAEQGLRTGRVGVLGWSMGGDGALELAARLGRGRAAAVAATSPAITASSARAYVPRLAGIPVWAGCGRSDGFAGPTERLLTALRATGARPEGGIFAGCHDAAFRRRMLPQQMTFLGAHLA